MNLNFQDTKFRPLTGIHDALRRPGLVRIAEIDHYLAQPEWHVLHEATERAAEFARDDARLSIAPLLLEIILLLRQSNLTRADPLIDAYIAISEHDGRFQTSSDARTYRGIYSLARGELDQAELIVSRAAAGLLNRDGHEEEQSAQTVHATMGQIRYLRNDIMGAGLLFRPFGRCTMLGTFTQPAPQPRVDPAFRVGAGDTRHRQHRYHTLRRSVPGGRPLRPRAGLSPRSPTPRTKWEGSTRSYQSCPRRR